MSKNIFSDLAELEENLQTQKGILDEKIDQLQILTLFANCYENFFVSTNILSGKDNSIVVLNSTSSFEKLITLIPENGRIYEHEESRSSHQGNEWVKTYHNYYILLDEKTVMKLTLCIERETGIQPFITCRTDVRRGNKPLTILDARFGRQNCFMIYDDYHALFRIANDGDKCNFDNEPLTNALPLINIKDTFMKNLADALGLELDYQRK